jgi:hypothetical protein
MGGSVNESDDSMEWVGAIYELVQSKLGRPNSDKKEWLEYSDRVLRDCAAWVLERNQVCETTPWGWKLPETMLIIPEVLHAFKNARIIHIVRHPVTCCLRRSHVTSSMDHPIGALVLRVARSMIGERSSDKELEPTILNNAYSWVYQVRSVIDYCRSTLGPNRYIEIRYEDLCDNWEPVRSSLANFLGVDERLLTRPAIAESRKTSFDLPDARIGPVWSITGTVARELGYDVAADGAPVALP